MEALLANIKSTGIFIIVLSVLIIVHEWGHFITAKKLGVKVEKFSLGFGKKLYSKMYNGTEFLVCLIPLGGYVKMAGDERNACKGSPDEFYSKSVGHRSLIVFNGPLVNYFLAYFCLVFVFMIGYPGIPTRIAEIIENSPAEVAGLQLGDKVIAINGNETYGWMHLESKLENTKSNRIQLTIERDGQLIDKTIIPNIVRKKNIFGQFQDIPEIGISPISPQTNEIGYLRSGMPAEKAGLKEGDEIINIDGVVIEDWDTLQETISNSKKNTLNITIDREGEEFAFAVIPDVKTREDESGKEKEYRVIGVSPKGIEDFEYYKFGFLESFQKGYEEIMFITTMTYKALYSMVIGSMSAKENVTGPVGIFVVVKEAAKMGVSNLLFIVGVISASLAIFNLLPIIPLDGGHLFLLILEKIRGKALSQKADEYIARLGFSFIILLALFVFYSDFDRFGIIDKVIEIFPKFG